MTASPQPLPLPMPAPLPPTRGSLRFMLMSWLVVPVLMILALSLWLSYANATRLAELVMNRNLLASARIMAEQARDVDGVLRVVIPPSALEIFDTDKGDQVAYRIVDGSGALVAGYPDLDLPPAPPAPLTYLFYDTVFRAEPEHAVAFSQPVATPSGDATVLIVVSETLTARQRLVRQLWLRDFLQEAALVLAGAVAVLIGIHFGLKPVFGLRDTLLRRPDTDFSPIDRRMVWTEIQPLVEALNAQMARLDRQISGQRRFLDNAAHQLRTPLAVLKTQIGFARRQATMAEVAPVLISLDKDLSGLSRMTNQLLVLARAENDRAAVEVEPLDLTEAARRVVSDAAPRAMDHGIELALQGEDAVPVRANPVLIHEMIANLVDNAIAYAGAGAVAVVSVGAEGDTAVLRVSDTGTGVALTEPQRLFERFRRGGQCGNGSGLGLSIVAEIARLSGGDARIVAGDARGFAVEISLPLHPDPAAGSA